MKIQVKYKTQNGGWKWYTNPDGTRFNFKSFAAAERAMDARNKCLGLKDTPYKATRVDLKGISDV